MNELPTVPGSIAAGSQIAGYTIEEQIGRGGMAVVYRASDRRLSRPVALKILAPELASDAGYRQRFLREMRAAAAVDHPNIVPVFDAGEADGALYIAMRYVDGHDVRTILETETRLPAARVVRLITQAASALDAAHARGLVHRDVKPGNMLIGSAHPDHLYLSDFGLSKERVSSAPLTLTGQFMGTLDYMAPEQIEGHELDGRTDLYALACTAFEMLAGQPPFKRDQGMAVMWAQVNAPVPSLHALRPDLPPGVDQVMATALAKKPADRYPSCAAFARALAAACGVSTGQDAEAGQAAADVPPVPPLATEGVHIPASRTSTSSGGDPPPDAESTWAGQPAAQAGAADPQSRAAGPQSRAAGPQSRAADPQSRAAGPQSRAAGPQSRAAGPQARAAGPRARAAGPRAAAADPQADAETAWAGRPLYRPDTTWRPIADSVAPAPSPWSASPPPQPPGQYQPRGAPPRPKRGRAGPVVAGVLTGVVVVLLAVAGVAFALHHKPLSGHNHQASPPPTSRPATTATSPPATALGPAATVRAYFAAINAHDYARAWTLGGKNTATSYSAFVNGFNGTARDHITVVSVAGDVVTVRLAATQTDGTVQHYRGTYTVANGIITQGHITLLD